jgi:hypothetical protein
LIDNDAAAAADDDDAGHGSWAVSRKQGSWVRVPHKEWMFGVYVFILFVLSCV